jgi:monolysocardiolipin acyltransferase
MSSGMGSEATADCPSRPWRRLSSATMFGVGALCRAFLLAGSSAEFHGLDDFMELLDSRQDESQRSRGLLTGTASQLSPSLMRR